MRGIRHHHSQLRQAQSIRTTLIISHQRRADVHDASCSRHIRRRDVENGPRMTQESDSPSVKRPSVRLRRASSLKPQQQNHGVYGGGPFFRLVDSPIDLDGTRIRS
jgi:hypothetical protein